MIKRGLASSYDAGLTGLPALAEQCIHARYLPATLRIKCSICSVAACTADKKADPYYEAASVTFKAGHGLLPETPHLLPSQYIMSQVTSEE